MMRTDRPAAIGAQFIVRLTIPNNYLHFLSFMRDVRLPFTMFWMLFRALCCLCQNRDTVGSYVGGGARYYDLDDDDDDDDNDDENDGLRNPKEFRRLKLSRLKRDAIEATVDFVMADKSLKQHGGDSSLLMYYDDCSHTMSRALKRLPVGPTRTQIKAIGSARGRAKEAVLV